MCCYKTFKRLKTLYSFWINELHKEIQLDPSEIRKKICLLTQFSLSIDSILSANSTMFFESVRVHVSIAFNWWYMLLSITNSTHHKWLRFYVMRQCCNYWLFDVNYLLSATHFAAFLQFYSWFVCKWIGVSFKSTLVTLVLCIWFASVYVTVF